MRKQNETRRVESIRPYENPLLRYTPPVRDLLRLCRPAFFQSGRRRAAAVNKEISGSYRRVTKTNFPGGEMWDVRLLGSSV